MPPAPTRVRNTRLAAAIAADGRPKYLVAAEARIPPNHLSAFLSGRQAPTPAQRARIADVLGVLEVEIFDAEVES